MTETIHMLRAPWDGADPRRDCKSQDEGANDPDFSRVTCAKCIDNERRRDESAWKRARSAEIATVLAEGVESPDGYDIWHERAGDVCLASIEQLSFFDSRRALNMHQQVEWYCKLSPIPERFTNRGWAVKVCYKLTGAMNAYEHADWNLPESADPLDMLAAVHQLQRVCRDAIKAGMRAQIAADHTVAV
jgi:hypothetical protein